MIVDADELKRRWRGVVRHYPAWRMLIDLFFDTHSWRLVGADLVSPVVQSKTARKAARALDGASPEMLTAISGLAAANAERANEVFRSVLLGYVSIPVALVALVSDAAPDALSEFLREQAPAIVIFLIGTLLFPIIYFCGSWRAKQIRWVIELYRAGALAPLPETRHEQDKSRR